MGKQTGKQKNQLSRVLSGDESVKQSKVGGNSPKTYDRDTEVFISMSRELKEDGNIHFQQRDYEGAMLKYEKALKLLPRNHIDVSYLRSNMAECHMQMGLCEYPRAIHECNLALEVTPEYSKALLKRARCYEGLNKLDLAFRDVNTVSNMEPNNFMALEIADRVKKAIEKKGIILDDEPIDLASEFYEAPLKIAKEKIRKKKTIDKVDEKKSEDKAVVEEKINTIKKEVPKKTIKLAFGEDIRLTQVPINCSLLQLREIIWDRFPGSKPVHIKYKDQEGDLLTITSNEELRFAEILIESQGSFRLYVVEVNPDQDPFFQRLVKDDVKNENLSGRGSRAERGSTYIDDWIVQFAQLFKNHIGFDSDAYLDFHELGMKVYSEAMEDTITSEEAQNLFDTAAEKFEEMAALALFNWGNAHISKARKKVYLTEDQSRESHILQTKTGYDWAQNEYSKAGTRYEEALKIKPDFHEALLALGQQQFEQAKLSWYSTLSINTNLETWSSTEVVELYNSAENNMDKGMQTWEASEKQRLNRIPKPKKIKFKKGLEGLFNMSEDESSEQAASMKSQINLLWGTMLYERSIMEFKLELPLWQECLEVSVEKFELAGASPTDICIMIKNHCSNNNAVKGIGFNIDEIIQAWNEMYEAKRWRSGVPSFRLKPLFRRQVSKLCRALQYE